MYIVALDSLEPKCTNQFGGTQMVTARQLASAYDLSVASIWRGERPENTMIAWLGDFRVTDGFNEPEAKPDAVSLLGGGGSGIRWYTTAAAVLGCTTGEPHVCYRIPLETELPREMRPAKPIVLLETEGNAVAR